MSILSYAQDSTMHVSFKIKTNKDSCIGVIDKITGGQVYYSQLLVAAKIDLQGCDNYIVHGFDMKIYNIDGKDSGKYVSYHSKGFRLTNEMTNALTKLDGNKLFQHKIIIFCNISARDRNVYKIIIPVRDMVFETKVLEPPPWREY